MVLLKAQRLQRLAEKLGRIESRLSRASGEVEGAEEELEDAAAATGVELEAVRRLDGVTLVRALSPGGRPDPGRLWAAAEVLYLDALRARSADEDATAAARLRKARRLYGAAAEASGPEVPEGAATPAGRIRAIDEALGEEG